MPPLQPSFASLGVPTDIVAALDRKSITEPFPIQSMTIPDALAGRDVCGKAPTGSGKTLAFGIGAVARLAGKPSRPRHPRVLVLAPTRELAAQVAAELQMLATPRNLRVDAFYGGVGYGPQLKALSRGVDVVVACPGRLGDLIERGSIRLDAVEIVVIDEADRMADMGFLPDVKRLLDLTPSTRQTLLFSATLDGDIDVLVRRYQHDPARHELEVDEDDINAAVHLFWKVASGDRIDRTADVVATAGPTIVFSRTKHGTDRIARQLEQRGVRAAAIHGDRSQKQREKALDLFVRGAVDALVATDVAARGIHVDGVNAVVHFDPPADAKDYVHRSGRTARAGATGVVVSFVTPDKAAAVKRLQRDLGVPMGTTGPDVSRITEVIGAPPERRPSQDRGVASAPTGGRGPTRGGRSGQGRRPGKPFGPRPDGARSGQPSSGSPRNGAAVGASRSGGTSPSGHDSGGPREPRATGPWETRGNGGKPGKPGKPGQPGKPGKPGKSGKPGRAARHAAAASAGGAPSSTRRGRSGRPGTGGHAGGPHDQRRGGPVGAKRGSGGGSRGR
jgi:superfamily II DNA/RNA helicase